MKESLISIDNLSQQQIQRASEIINKFKDEIKGKQYDVIYKYLEGENGNLNMTTVMTLIFRKSHVDPLKYMNTVPKYYAINSDIGQIVIPDNIEVIDEFAFYGCKNLYRVVLPNSIRQIKAEAFSNVDLESLVYKGKMKEFDNIVLNINWATGSSFEIECTDESIHQGDDIY